MSIFNEFPYTNIHELNLDWLIKAVKEATDKIDNFTTNWEDQVQDDVNNWLDEHPEATTTVQDNSLTVNKFTAGAKLEIVKDYVTPEMFGAVGDGVADDTAAVKAALADVRPTALLSTYRVTEPLTGVHGVVFGLPKETTGDYEASIIWDDNITSSASSLLVADARLVMSDVKLMFGSQSTARHSFSAENVNGLYLHNVRMMDGNGYALKITGASNIIIDGCQFINITGVTGNPGGAIYGQKFHDCIISNCFFDHIYDHVLYCAGDAESVYNVVVDNCVCSHIGTGNLTNGAAFAIYAGCHDITITNCVVSSAKSGVYVGKYGSATTVPEDIEISNCTFRSMTENGVMIDGISSKEVMRCSIMGCEFHGVNQDAIRLQEAIHCLVKNCTVFNATRYGIVLGDCEYCLIDGNSLRNCTATGINVGYPNPANNNQITNNMITASGGTTGLYIRQSHANRLFNNYVNGYTTNFVTGGQDEMNIASSTYQKSITFAPNVTEEHYHSVGDIVINSNPSAGGPAMWICTAAGSPGTMKVIATVSA